VSDYKSANYQLYHGDNTYIFNEMMKRKHAALRRKIKDWLAGNHDNVSEWDNMSTRRRAQTVVSVS
jgi:hypothetical protein